ncbi:hypothetical protein UG56_019495 [Nocardioides luteus]|uniref:Glycosyltransferase RgtA/B/C/D-like domain-containing protein n=2 Tax=Nocardioides luteus TaxID=1844 RepID=A0A1J4N0N5_9ACTN|nr:hypothetical protein UG56_019495 [Nocardioides luteus]
MAYAAVLLASLVTTAAWLPFLHRPLTSDEAGFLMLAQQWRPGHSLYGSYWVDRPPLLLWLFAVAGQLGPSGATAAGFVAPGVKVLGALAGVVSVALAGLLAGLVAPTRRGRIAAVVLSAALLSSPLTAMPEVDGELLAVPFVLAGLVCLVAGMRGAWGWRTAGLAAGAGAAGMSAVLVKQNVLDVFVFGAVLAVVSLGRVPRLGRRVGAFAGGATTVLGAVLAGAWTHGTTFAGLWHAVVLFRGQASEVIDASASGATLLRGAELAAASVATGAAVVLVVGAAAVLGHRTRLARPALAMIGWEVFAIAAGGSYWLHYLTGVVPGLVLLVAIAPARSGRALARAVTYAVAATLTVWTYRVAAPPPPSPEAQVSTYLREHSHRPTDGVVVGFGHAEIVAASGLHSPYEYLWSLPVRVRDPHLARLLGVLAGPSAPRWVVVDGGGLDTWGVDADDAQQYLLRHYVERVSYDSWQVWERR